MDLIISLKNKYIVWPDSEEAEDVENDFKVLKGFPGVIGALDGCNIVFKCPNIQQYSYIDKNKNNSFKIMAVATSRNIFTYVNCGFPGSAHDSRVSLNCGLNQNIEDGRINEYFYQEKFYILGDKAFGLKNWLLTPYKESNNLDERQRHYNRVHSKTRIVVEHTFGILKSRWRIMKGINTNSIVKAIKIGVTCTVLHNFCYINTDFWEEYAPIEDFENLEEIANAEVFGVVNNV